jgi:hypothetical protein
MRRYQLGYGDGKLGDIVERALRLAEYDRNVLEWALRRRAMNDASRVLMDDSEPDPLRGDAEPHGDSLVNAVANLKGPL